jgi:hypothetical protein
LAAQEALGLLRGSKAANTRLPAVGAKAKSSHFIPSLGQEWDKPRFSVSFFKTPHSTK